MAKSTIYSKAAFNIVNTNTDPSNLDSKTVHTTTLVLKGNIKILDLYTKTISNLNSFKNLKFYYVSNINYFMNYYSLLPSEQINLLLTQFGDQYFVACETDNRFYEIKNRILVPAVYKNKFQYFNKVGNNLYIDEKERNNTSHW